LGTWSPLAAQTAPSTPDSSAKTKAADHAPLVSRSDVALFGGATLLTVGLAPFDRNVQRNAHEEDLRHDDLQHAANAFAFTGGPGPFVVGGALYLAGRTTGQMGVARLGVTLTEGVILAATLNGVVKGFAGRALPDASVHPGHFSFGRGFHDNNGPFVSFPSGHTAASFAAATVLTEESASWGSEAPRFVAPAAYATATLVAVSRLYENVHWASDLPMGAAIGIWSGKTVAGWQRRHPDNWLTRRLLGIDVAPQKHGLLVTAAMPLGEL
jgi:membrane-associated phospholipid phosphatase